MRERERERKKESQRENERERETERERERWGKANNEKDITDIHTNTISNRIVAQQQKMRFTMSIKRPTFYIY